MVVSAVTRREECKTAEKDYGNACVGLADLGGFVSSK